MVPPDLAKVFAEWELGDDGLWARDAARAIVVDSRGRTLLLQGFDVGDPERQWWFTPGGGVEPGESEREAAARELLEESGLRVAADALIGPVAARSAEFTYFGRRCRQREVLFFARVGDTEDISTDGWTAVERASVTQARWWEIDALVEAGETVFPGALPALVRELHTRRWDGRLRQID